MLKLNHTGSIFFLNISKTVIYQNLSKDIQLDQVQTLSNEENNEDKEEEEEIEIEGGFYDLFN